MPATPESRARAWISPAAIFATLAAVIGATQYSYASGFGLYQDDYSRIPLMLGLRGGEAAALLWDEATQAYGGRTLHELLIYGLTSLGDRIGPLWGLYVLAFAISTINAWLFYLIAHRLFGQTAVAFGAALAFAAFPADFTRTWLTSAFGLQTSLLLLLGAIYFYVKGRSAAAYTAVALTLLTYEVVFPVFLAVPLLGERRGRELAREFFRNAAILAAIFGAVALTRMASGEQRLAQLDLGQALAVVLTNMIQGPLLSLASYLIRPLQALAELTTLELLMLVGSFGLVAGVLTSVGRLNRDGPESWEAKRLARMAGGGLAMLVLAYALSIDGEIRAMGIGSRVHLAAAVGAALLVACVIAGAYHLARGGPARHLVTVGLAGCLTLVSAARFPIQHDYVASWRIQRQLWSDLLRLTPDLDQGDRILLVDEQLPSTRFVPVISWEAYHTFRELQRFPPDWSDPPRLLKVPGHVAADASRIGGQVHLDPEEYPWARGDQLDFPAERAIVVGFEGGELIRRPRPPGLADRERPALPMVPGVLYDLLIRGGT